MAIFPKIQSPCPYKSQLASIMDGDMCRMCERQVFDLNHMSDGERVAFLAGCSEEVCVSYSFPLRPAIAAAAMAAAMVAFPTAAAAQAQEAPVENAAVEEALADVSPEDRMITVGGIKDPANVEYVDVRADAAVPELPIVYENGPAGESGSAVQGDHASRPAGAPVSNQPAGGALTSVIPSH